MIQKEAIKAKELAQVAVEGIEGKKGKDIICLDLRKLPHAVCEFFVVCTGNTDRQVGAISDSVEETIRKKTTQKPWHVEGKENLEWVLIDYFDVVVHIFKPESRAFYSLEELWADGKIVNFEA